MLDGGDVFLSVYSHQLLTVDLFFLHEGNHQHLFSAGHCFVNTFLNIRSLAGCFSTLLCSKVVEPFAH